MSEFHDKQINKTDRGPAGPQVYKPAAADDGKPARPKATLPKEIGGREGPEPVRYGDWEKNGRCIDF